MDQPRRHKVKDSIGLGDMYSKLRKVLKGVDRKMFCNIVKACNRHIAEELGNGNDITLPDNMGRMEIRKFIPKVHVEGDKVYGRLPVNWNETLSLWNRDPQARKEKLIIYRPYGEVFKLRYVYNKAKLKNKWFYEFKFNRNLKLRLKDNINNNLIDAFTYK